ncbi:MAG: L,D-transpeptidase family protein [bacterium]
MGVLIFILAFTSVSAKFNASVELPLNSELILISKNEGLLRVMKKGKDQYEKTYEFFASYGQAKGKKLKEDDLKTPVGIYFATEIMTRGDLPDNKYGSAAIVLNYPNTIDTSLKRTGKGIWIHGTEDIERLSNKKSTLGCIILENEDLLKLINNNKISVNKTPIIIINKFDDVRLLGSDIKQLTIEANDGTVKYRVTIAGLEKPSILYERLN